MDMPNKARLEALNLVRSEQKDFTWFSPEPEEYLQFEPDSNAAIEYWWSLKPRRYASLARTLGATVNDHLFGEEDLFRNYLREPVRYSDSNPWWRMSLNASAAFAKAHERVADTAAYYDSRRFEEILRELSPSKYIDLATQLNAGAKTMTATMFTTLRNIPRISHHHDKEIKVAESGAIARNSVGLPWRLAMSSINQMTGMEAVLAKDTNTKKWTKIDAVLDPEEYTLVSSNDSNYSLQYDNILKAEVPPDYKPSRRQALQGGPQVKDIMPFDNAAVIGCPITLIDQAVHQLWEAKIDVIEEHELWARETDPQFMLPPYQPN